MSTNKRKPSATLTKIMSSITKEDKRRTCDRMLIAVKIANALEERKLSQKAFAELMKKSESEISDWLSGNRNFTVDTLSDISDCLGIHLLPCSEMRTKSISLSTPHRKITKTRSPYSYIVSGNSVFSSTTCEWSTSNNQTFAVA